MVRGTDRCGLILAGTRCCYTLQGQDTCVCTGAAVVQQKGHIRNEASLEDTLEMKGHIRGHIRDEGTH